MSVLQVPNLPSAIALNGSELYESVQAGVSVKVTTNQIAAFTASQYPAPGVAAIVGAAPISTTGSATVTVSLQTAGVSNAYLASMPVATVKANVTGSPAQPTDATVSAVLDTIGSTRGSLLYRGVVGWAILPPASTAGYVLTNNGTSTDPSWGLPGSFSSLTVSSPLQLTGSNISLMTVPATLGGTGQTSFTVGDLLYAGTTTALSKLADAATGNALISGGVGVAPSYGKIGLTTHVSGTLPIANGGTNNTSYTGEGVVYYDGTKFASTAAGTTGQVLSGNTGLAPTWMSLSAFGVTSVSFGTTGLTPNSPTAGDIVVAGTLATANGGTGLTGFAAANNAIYSTSSSALTAGTLPVLAGGTGVTTATGAGAVVRATSPTLVTPTLGVALATSLNGLTVSSSTGTLTIANGKTATFSNTLTFAGSDGTTVNFGAGGTLAAVAYSGSASDLSSGTLPSGRLSGSYTGVTGVGTLTAGTWHATTIGLAYGGTGSDLSATGGTSQVLMQSTTGAVITVGQLAASDLSNGVTGSGAVVLATSPILVTPTLGVATATSINKVAITAPATGSTLTIANGKTLTVSATLGFGGSDGTSFVFPGSGTVLTADSTATLTGKTYDTAGTGNAFKIAGVGISAVTGTGAAVLATSAALVGTPTTPTPPNADNSTQIINSAWFQANAVNQSTTGPTVQTLTSGTAATYTRPAGVKWIWVRMVGGGAAGGGGGSGGTTTFNSVNAAGGSVGNTSVTGGALGGAGGSGGSGSATLRKAGAAAVSGISDGTYGVGGAGAASVFGGSGKGGAGSGGGATGSGAAANTGAGGGGGGVDGVGAGGGGGAGEYVELIIANPSASYTYTIGSGGTGGGVNSGGAGGSGVVIVTEFYNF